MRRFEKQVALITGGAAGIGFATARRIAAEGGRVVVLDNAEPELRKAVATLEAAEAECLALCGSVTSEDDCHAAVSLALERWDRLDVLVANAGVRAYGSLLDATADDWDQVLSVNLRGTANVCSAAAQAMRVCGAHGAIVLVSSVHAEVARANMPIYDATKAALLSLARSLAVDLAGDGIRVNSVCPGFTLTDYHVRRAQQLGEPVGALREAPVGLFKRPAQPHEVAAAIAFLASCDAAYITATNLMVDAGVHAT